MQVGTAALEWDVFISCRQDALPLAKELANKLKARGVTAAFQENTKDISDSNHASSSKKIINRAKFVLFLVSKDFYSPSSNGGLNYFLLEVENAENRAVSEAQMGFRSAEFARTAVLLQTNEAEFTELVRRLVEERALHSDPVSSLASLMRIHLDWALNHQSEEIDEAINDLALEIEGRVRDIKKAIKARKAREEKERLEREAEEAKRKKDGDNLDGDVKPPSVEPPNPRKQMEDLHAAYLNMAILAWRSGRIGDNRARSARTKKTGDSPFSFDATRFIGSMAEGRSDGIAASQRQPCLQWLLTPHGRPVVLNGDAGLGKTTNAAAAALAYAMSVGHAAAAAACRGFSGGRWYSDAKTWLGTGEGYAPIAISCAQCVDAIKDSFQLDQEFSSQRLLDCLVAAMLRSLPDYDTRNASGLLTGECLRLVLEGKPHVLIVDGFDEISTDVAEALSAALETLFAELGGGEGRFRLIVTGRDSQTAYPKPNVRVRLAPLERGDINQFIDDYARASRTPDAARQKIAAAAAKLFHSADSVDRHRPVSTQRLLTSPLHLNAFCWQISERGGFDGNLQSFLRTILAYYLENREFPVFEQRVPKGDEAAAIDAVRRALGWLALEAHTGDPKGVIAQTSASQRMRDSAELGDLDIGTLDRARKLLKELERRTEMFTLSERDVSFKENLVFCEYLAGEEIARRGAASFVRERLTNGDVTVWQEAMGHAAALEAGAGASRGDTVHSVLLGALEAKLACPSAKTALQVNGLVRLTSSIIHVLGAVAAESEAASYEGALALMALIRDLSQSLDAKRRADLINAALRLAARDSEAEQARVVHAMLDALLVNRTRWKAIDRGDRATPIAVADTPVLVADYMAFAREKPDRDSGAWAPALKLQPDYEDDLTELICEADELGDFHSEWFVQRENLGWPVLAVTWFEAVAYCEWLTQRMRADGRLCERSVVRLPTPSEWTALATQFAGDSLFPWGDELDGDRVNFRGGEIDGPSPPGAFKPNAFGIYDFGSNVRCWTTPDRADGIAVWPPMLKADGVAHENPRAAGASWNCDDEPAFRPGTRARGYLPTRRSLQHGFRLILSGPTASDI